MKSFYRRIGILIDGIAISLFCKDSTFTIKDSPIPKDAKFLGAFFDNERNSFIVYFDHRSFKKIPIGDKIPLIHMEKKGKSTTIFTEVPT